MKEILYRWITGYMTRMGLILWGKDSGGGAPAPTTQTIQQNTIAPEAAPYYSTVLGQAAGLTDIANNP